MLLNKVVGGHGSTTRKIHSEITYKNTMRKQFSTLI